MRDPYADIADFDEPVPDSRLPVVPGMDGTNAAYGGGGRGTGSPLRVNITPDGGDPYSDIADPFDDSAYDPGAVGTVDVPPSEPPTWGGSFANAAASIGQGLSGIPDAATEAVGAVLGEGARYGGKLIGAGADALGFDGESIRRAGRSAAKSFYDPITIGGLIEKAVPTPEDMTGKGVRVAGQLGAGFMTIPGVTPFAKSIPKMMGLESPKPLLARVTAAQEVSEAAEGLSEFTGQPIRLLPADVGGPLVRRITAGAVQSPYGTAPIIEAAKESVGTIKAARDSLAKRAGPVADEEAAGSVIRDVADSLTAQYGERISGIRNSAIAQIGEEADPTTAGQLLQRGANRTTAETATRGEKLFEAIPIAGGRLAPLTNTRSALQELTAGMESNPDLSRLVAENPRLKAFLGALTPRTEPIVKSNVAGGGGKGWSQIGTAFEGGQLSWQDLKRFRSIMGEIIGQPSLAEDTATSHLRTLYGALTKDMEATARAEGPKAYQAWKRANDFWRGRQKRIDETLAAVLGQRRDATASEALGQLERWMKPGAGADAANIGRLFRSIPAGDVATVRATIAGRMGVGRNGEFSAEAFARQWGKMPDREKAAMFPSASVRASFDDVAQRAVAGADELSLPGTSGTQAFSALNRMAGPTGDPAKLSRLFNALSPEEASMVRATWISRAGMARAGAQDAAGEVFSPDAFLTQWNTLTPRAKAIMFGGSGDLRGALDDLAKITEGIKEASKYANASNTAGASAVNITNGGLGGAVIALLTGHPIVAAGMASPAATQAITGRMMASPRFVRWLTRGTKVPNNPGAIRSHIAQLTAIATRDPAAADITAFQRMLQGANDNVGSAAAASAGDAPERERE